MLADWSEILQKGRAGPWDLRDGRLLMVLEGDDEVDPRELTVVVNGREMLERRLRADR